MISIKSRAELARMREAGRIVALALQAMKEQAKPGITTAELNLVAEEVIRKHNAIPAFKGYPPDVSFPFPATVCVSLNQELVHGIPGPREVRLGDIVSLDVGAVYQGYYGDAAVTIAVGPVDREVQRLLDVTRQSLDSAIAQVRPGRRLWDVIQAVQTYVEQNGFTVIRQYQGHGIGTSMHEEPNIPNFLGDNRMRPRNVRLEPGMTLAIEPMVAMGSWETFVMPDQWTVVMADGELSAHFEHTVAVTENGAEILTLP
jgi:methionyl aminopeptidase